MYARSTTIQAELSAIDTGIAFLRDKVQPVVLSLDGCVGLSLVVDRDAGRIIVTTSWETTAAMKASAAAVSPLRDEGTKAFGGTIEGVQEWEVAILHREHATREGTCVRVSWLRGAPADVDRAVDAFRTIVLPTAQDMTGFCSASLLVDRKTGRLAGATAWDNRAAMVSSRQGADQLRTKTSEEFGGTIEEVREFELAIAHLRVPELV